MAGQKVNLERALKLGERLGGHWVTGHVDCVGEIVREQRVGDSLERWIRIDERYIHQVAEKGSVAVDGMSLTVSYKEPWGFSVTLIPYTLAVTTANAKKIGSFVNIETDILAKYTESLSHAKEKSLSLEAMKEMGY